MTNEEVGEVARHILRRRRRSMSMSTDDISAAQSVADHLTEIAYGRNSSDNISIIVVDLKTKRKRQPRQWSGSGVAKIYTLFGHNPILFSHLLNYRGEAVTDVPSLLTDLPNDSIRISSPPSAISLQPSATFIWPVQTTELTRSISSNCNNWKLVCYCETLDQSSILIGLVEKRVTDH